MNVHIAGKHLAMSPALTGYTHEQFQRLISKYALNPLQCEVLFSKKNSFFLTEVNCHLEKNLFLRAKSAEKSAYLSLDRSLTNLDKKIRKQKRLDLQNKHRDCHADQYVLQESVLQKQFNTYPPIIAEQYQYIPTLSVSEAVTHMDISNLPVMIFKNIKQGSLNVIYKRQDGNIGWIDSAS